LLHKLGNINEKKKKTNDWFVKLYIWEILIYMSGKVEYICNVN
jgi:hypothetical protein